MTSEHYERHRKLRKVIIVVPWQAPDCHQVFAAARH